MFSFCIISWGTKQYQEMIFLRNECLRIPLSMYVTDEEIAKDKNDILIAAFSYNVLVGCCILTDINSDTFKLRQMAVATLLQQQGLGKQILTYAEYIAQQYQQSKIILESRLYAQPFYQKAGYQPISEVYSLIGIPHIKMIKNIIPNQPV